MKYIKITFVLCVFLYVQTGAGSPSLNHEPLWFDENNLTNSGIEFVSLLADLGYRSKTDLTADELTHKHLTAKQLTHALIDVSALAINHQIDQPKLSLLQINQAYKQNRLEELIDKQLPQFNQVRELRAAIGKMRHLSQSPWPIVSRHFTPRLGQRHPEIKKLVYMLVKLGDLNLKSKTLPDSFSPSVIAALKRFQRRHHVRPSGKIDDATRQLLALSPTQKLKRLQLNLRRWLSLPSIPPQRYVSVNIPSATLSYYSNQRKLFSMAVIVGHPDTPTPIMLTEITSVTANPVWRPPKSIIEQDLLANLAQYPIGLSEQQFYWRGREDRSDTMPISQSTLPPEKMLLTYRLEQGPGEYNALGRWRFNIKNFEAIYLHDTPVKHLFNRSSRAISHGCIRLNDPQKLANALLIEPLISEQTRTVRLPEPMPTFINYQTMAIEHDKLIWFNDIYQLDAAQLDTTLSQLNSIERI